MAPALRCCQWYERAVVLLIPGGAVNPDGFDSGASDALPGEPETNTSEAGPTDIFDGLVLDEAFVLAALIHEPSAEERLKLMRSEGRRRGRAATAPKRYDQGGVNLSTGIITRRGRYQAMPGRWQRAVARVMLVVIGVLTVMVAAAAVYRGAAPSARPLPHSSSGNSGSSSGSRGGASGNPVVGSPR